MNAPRVTIEKEDDLFAVYVEDQTSRAGERRRWHIHTTPDFAGACAIAWKKATSATDKSGGVLCENIGIE